VEQSDVLRFAVNALERLGIRYAVVGSFASGVWGESRFTQDVDILIEIAAGQVKSLCDAFPDKDFYVSETAAREASARHSQFNVIHPASGNKIDFMIAGPSAWTKAQLERRKVVELFPGQSAAIAAPEDVIIGKLVYYREGQSDKHLRDITGILTFSSDIVDRSYIAIIAKQVGVTEIWQMVLDRMQQQ
jgi:hypothetical protein